MIRTTLQTLESRTSQFLFTSSRRAQSSWIPPSKRRSVRYGSCSTSTQQSQSQQRRPVVNGQILPFHVNDLKKTQHHVASTTTSSSFSSQQRRNHNNNKNGSSNNNIIKQNNTEPLRKYDSDLIVVLDMDECLIHSQFLQDSPGAKYAHQVQQRGSSSSDKSSLSKSSVDTFNITLPDGERVLVHERPYLHEFLKEVSSKYETHIFTAAMEVYAKPVLDILDPHGDIFTNIYYRESCQLNSTVGAYVKNLEGLGLFCDDDSDSNSNESIHNKRRLNRTVLVDNNPLSFLANPDNGILVSSFYDDSRDTTLPAVMDLIHGLDEHEDVRPILDARFQLRQALNDVSLGRPFSGRQQQIDQQDQQQQQQQHHHEQQHKRIALATAF